MHLYVIRYMYMSISIITILCVIILYNLFDYVHIGIIFGDSVYYVVYMVIYNEHTYMCGPFGLN